MKNNPYIKFYNFSKTETPWFIDIYTSRRDQLFSHLKKKKINTRKVYPSISTQKIFKTMNKLKNCEKICNKGLWLPSSLNLSHESIKKIAKEINIFFKI